MEGPNLSRTDGARVLFLGVGQRNFLEQLAGAVRQTSRASFSVLNPQAVEEWNADLVRPVRSAVTVSALIGSGFRVSADKGHLRRAAGIAALESPRKAAGYLVRQVESDAEAKQIDWSEVDIVHCHYLTWYYARHLWSIPMGRVAIVSSFWGSDLLRVTDGIRDQSFVRWALEVSNIITVQSVEMRQIVGAKYGWDLAPKIRVLRFAQNYAIFDAIDSLKDEQNIRVKGCDGHFGALQIVVGHNGNPANNHVAILEALKKLGSTERSRLHLVFPMTYGTPPGYAEEIQKLGCEVTPHVTMIRDYMDAREMALLWVNSHIFLHLPTTDALSGAATEAMYAGCWLVTGAWLPYGPFRRAGAQYEEVSSFSNLPDAMERAFAVISDSSSSWRTANRSAIDSHFIKERIGDKWADVYEDALHGIREQPKTVTGKVI